MCAKHSRYSVHSGCGGGQREVTFCTPQARLTVGEGGGATGVEVRLGMQRARRRGAQVNLMYIEKEQVGHEEVYGPRIMKTT